VVNAASLDFNLLHLHLFLLATFLKIRQHVKDFTANKEVSQQTKEQNDLRSLQNDPTRRSLRLRHKRHIQRNRRSQNLYHPPSPLTTNQLTPPPRYHRLSLLHKGHSRYLRCLRPRLSNPPRRRLTRSSNRLSSHRSGLSEGRNR
jgi:hypothetical protein